MFSDPTWTMLLVALRQLLSASFQQSMMIRVRSLIPREEIVNGAYLPDVILVA